MSQLKMEKKIWPFGTKMGNDAKHEDLAVTNYVANRMMPKAYSGGKLEKGYLDLVFGLSGFQGGAGMEMLRNERPGTDYRTLGPSIDNKTDSLYRSLAIPEKRLTEHYKSGYAGNNIQY